ncbi:porin family protein [Geojedonia litorea]|uniref:Porin family protein n=1 Tax=Geojedonia litorea TaxID=1268269 RepID=A0ABV9N2R4_9FLAO
MKRSHIKINAVILFLTLLSGLQSISAQSTEYGVKAGYNLSNLSTEFGQVNNQSGFHVGGLVEFKVSNKFSIQPELVYSLEGGKFRLNYSESSSEGDFELRAKEDVKLGFINLPVSAKYYVIDKFSLEVGPQLGYVVSAKSEYDYYIDEDGEITSDAGKQNIKDDIKSFNFSLNFGLGYELKNKMFFQARYNLGLTDLDDSNDSSEDGNYLGKIKSKGVLFSIGYKF